MEIWIVKQISYHCAIGKYGEGNVCLNSRHLDPDYLGKWMVVKMSNPIFMTYYKFLQRTTFAIRSPMNFRVYASNDGLIGLNYIKLRM